MKKTGKNTLLKLEGLKNLAQSDELRTGKSKFQKFKQKFWQFLRNWQKKSCIGT
jgi:hypothetical protein